MGSFGEEECFYPESGVIRPTFLPLAMKRNPFYPSLPETPEHGRPFDTMIGITDCDVTDWELLSSSRLDVTKKPYYDDSVSDVFTTPAKEKKLCDEKTVTTPPCAGDVKTNKTGLCSQWDTSDGHAESPCCSQWLRAYISKLWVKAPTEPPPETPPKPKQLTILEREFTFKQLSPKRLRRFTRKRHSATSQFIYSAFIEDTVVELREERHEDVVYSITIKKDGSLPRNDSLPRTSSASKSFSEDDIMREKNTSRHLKGATLDFMVGRLARVFVNESDDANFLNVFLTTYRTFATPDQLLTKLHDEYMKLKDESSTKNMAVLKSIVRVLRAWLERYMADDFQDNSEHKLLRRLLSLAKVHDDVMNENDGRYIDRKPTKRPVSPLSPRNNGVVLGAGFADYVMAKMAAGVKAMKEAEASGSPLSSPTHSQNPTLDVLGEGSMLNVTAAKQFLNTLSSRHVAAQLTVIAAKLFHRVQPHHCLATVASTKSRLTVRATIDQFNRVVYCVVGTILCKSLKPPQRTKLLTKWIEVAQECRELKNFSSLRAIVSGLQTYALHRLKRAWMGVPQSHTNLLKELADMNMKDLLLKVGTAKVNTEDSSISRVRKEATMRRVQDIHSGIMHGTVPYLGSFLTDLTYLDSARPNFLEGGLINFEKRRKEFELLAQLQLWQASCRSYQNLEPDHQFLEWFQSVTVLTEEQTFQLSEAIEPPASNVTSPSHVTSPVRKTLTDMIHSEAEKNMSSSPGWQKQRKNEDGVGHKENKLSQSFSGRINTTTPTANAQNRIVKIRLVRNKAKDGEDDVPDGKVEHANEEAKCEPVATCDYKTLSISADERRAAVIRRALDLYTLDVETNLKRFSLVQVLQDKEIQIPDTANVFYAMSSSDQEPTLLLLEEGASLPHKVKRHQSTPLKPKKPRHRKNHSISYALGPESGRPSPLSTAVSPMKSLYRQLAFGSVTLVGGASYSVNDGAVRPSDGEGEIAGTGGVVLLNSKSGEENDPARDAWIKRAQTVRAPTQEVGVSENGLRSARCYSADYATSVVLPIRVVKPSAALSAGDSKLPKSAPCSPRQDRRNKSMDAQNNIQVMTATGKLVEWPRYKASVNTRSHTWSSRRALKKAKKSRSTSTFYVNKTLPSPSEEPSASQESSSRSTFYVEMKGASSSYDVEPKPMTSYYRSFSSNTLPPRLVPDYSGHDYDAVTPLRSSISVDARHDGIGQWDDTLVRKSISFASVTSNQSHENGAHSDSGSGISFSASTHEDNVFNDVSKSPVNTDMAPEILMKRDSETHSPTESLKAPVIKIQCASPENLLDESGFFDRYTENHGDSESTSSEGENLEDHSTYL